MIREVLDRACKECGKRQDEADEIFPTYYGKYSVGPDWVCGDCLEGVAWDQEVPPE